MEEMALEHGYLLSEGIWGVEGEYRDRHGRHASLRGRVETRHLTDMWLNLRTIHLHGDTHLELNTAYEIVPLKANTRSTTWVTADPRIGSLDGLLEITPEYILSLFSSTDGRYSGAEYLLRSGDDCYHCRGIIFAAGERWSSWSAQLVRQQA